jgi:hypothetical protein
MKYFFPDSISRLILFTCFALPNPAGYFQNRSLLKISLLLAMAVVTVGKTSAETPDEMRIIHSWQLRDLYTRKQSIETDTMINSFQIHNPVFQRNISSSYLGNPGLAVMPDFFPDRDIYSDFFFIDHFNIYLHQPQETKYYNTRRPFSLIDFSTGGPRGKNSKILDILHTQNVNPDFNVGFRYFNINSDGQYQHQGAVTNAISLFSSYELDNYQFHTNLNFNSARVFENGGLADDASLYNRGFDSEDHAVRLQNVRNGIRNNSFFIAQSWQPFLYSRNDTLPETENSWLQRFEIYHVLLFDQYKRTYEDNNPPPDFYAEFLINNTNTFDSLYYRNLTNMLMLELPEFSGRLVSFGAKAGIKNELIKGSYNILPDTTFIFAPGEIEPIDFAITDRRQSSRGSNALIASARGGLGDVFGIWGEASYFFQGFKSGDYDFQGGIDFDLFEGKNRSILETGLQQKQATPSMFLKSFFSNHFAWENEFRQIGQSSLKGSISMPERNFAASVNFDLISNYIYFDHTANPQQYNDIIPVVSASVKKDFSLGRFHSRSMINYQVSGKQDILPLPDISVYHSTWFERELIPGILNMQIGFDAYYSTAYYGYAYQPAISQFHLQNERKIGNYPYLDVFVNFKHKRTRFFFKAEHLNAGWSDPEYFNVLHYPRSELMLKLGVSWSFYT